MIYNYVNFIKIFYDKELLALNYSKLNAFILIHCGLYIICITICFKTFEAYNSCISHILTFIIIIIYYHLLLFILKIIFEKTFNKIYWRTYFYQFNIAYLNIYFIIYNSKIFY